jgi:hypothetical protein
LDIAADPYALIWISAATPSDLYVSALRVECLMFGTMHDMVTTAHMTWPMGAGMALLGVVLVLAAVALVKYVIIR